jgi:hypothetical protein
MTSAILQICSVVLVVSITAMIATGSFCMVYLMIRLITEKDAND